CRAFSRLVAAGELLGHYTFMSLGHHAREEVAALTHDPVREGQERLLDLGQQFTEPHPPLVERLLHEGAPSVEEQIEDEIADRQPLHARTERPAGMALVPLQQSRKVRPAALEYDQFAIEHRAGRQTP